MLYLKNSLVNLIIISSLIYSTNLSSEENTFIFPKKKFIIIKIDETKQRKIEEKNSARVFVLPQKNQFRKNVLTKKRLKNNVSESQEIKKEKIKDKIVSSDLTKSKSVLRDKNKTLETINPYLEKETLKKINEIKKRSLQRKLRKF